MEDKTTYYQKREKQFQLEQKNTIKTTKKKLQEQKNSNIENYIRKKKKKK